MIQIINAFATEDGKLFSTMEEAEAHQQSLGIEDDLQAFLASDDNVYKSPAYSAIVRKAITNWERWKNANR